MFCKITVYKYIYLVISFVIVLTSAVYAGDNNTSNDIDPEKRLQDLISGKVELEKSDKEIIDSKSKLLMREDNDPAYPGVLAGVKIDSVTNEKYLQALREYYVYRVEGLKHRRQVFKWQLLSAKMIFVTVIIIVMAGLYFAWVQFHIGMKSLVRGKSSENSEFSASLEGGIKISSPVLGVVILSISLAFFYLYLVYVYPIEDIF